MLNSSKFLSRSLVLLGLCLLSQSAEATYGSGKTSTYVFVAEQSKVVQTGGIAYVHWTYSIKGHFQLTVDPNAGTASFANVDANATDDSPFKRTLDLNHVFNMTSLAGTVEPSGSIKFTGKAPDDSDVLITVTLQDGSAHLIGQTIPPPNSADFFIFSLDAVAQRKYGGGSGTAEDPYQIATAEDLVALGETPADYDKHFILTDDIDLTGHIFDKAVIAPDTDPSKDWGQGTPFTGVFDGSGHTISHLTIKGGGYLGLFGQLGWDLAAAKVKNMGVVDVNIIGSGRFVGGLVGYNNYGDVAQCYSTGAVSATSYVGGLVGYNWIGDVTHCSGTCQVSGDDNVAGLVALNYEGHVTNCYSTGAVNGKDSVGGLVGVNARGHVSHCYSASAVTGASDVGGLAGTNFEGTVTQCYSTGAVSGSGARVGGLVGYNSGSVTDCYSTGMVSGATEIGGLVGYNSGKSGDVAHCYSTGAVSGTYNVGGLVGYNPLWAWGRITSSFWDIDTSGRATGAGGTGKTTAEMQTASTFLEAGWDFVNVWGIGENQTYPYLPKYSAADINQDASVNFLDLAVLAENWLATE
jgi:hypothetical protein